MNEDMFGDIFGDDQEMFGGMPLGGGLNNDDFNELKRIVESGDSPMKFIERLEKKGILVPMTLKLLAKKYDYDLVHIDFLSDEEVKLFNDFNNLVKDTEKEMEKINKRIELKRDLFWNHVRDRLDLCEEKEISIDPITQSVQKRVKKS